MPADSEARDTVTLPHTWRPLGVRLAGGALGGGLLILVVGAWVAFPPEVKDTFTLFQRGTAIGLGLMAFAAWFALLRSRVVATTDHLTGVNRYKPPDIEWAQVVAIHMPPGAPWATLDLDDGDTCPVMGIQSSDGDRSRLAVRQVRALLLEGP
ncbi:MAG: PH domain-containing protein [Nocardioides sp.]